MNRVYHADALATLRTLPDALVSLIYIDPPYNTGTMRRMTRTVNHGEIVSEFEYADEHTDYSAWLMAIITEARRVLTPTGSIYVHLDWREVHRIKCELDSIFGSKSFMNEIIWSFDYGARSKTYWPRKHSTILWYVMNPRAYIFNYEAMDREPYMAPTLVGKEKAARGTTPTDVWWQTVVATNGQERTGYADQKPLPIVERIVRASSHPGDLVMDFFAGSGTTGEAAFRNGRRFLLVDTNPQAIEVMRSRFARVGIAADAREWIEYE